MNFSISKISLRTRLLTITAFALIALLIAVLSAYRTARTSEFYAERQAQTSVMDVLRQLSRGITDEEDFRAKRKMPPHIREAFEKHKDVFTRSAVVALNGEREISAGYCSSSGQQLGAKRSQKFSSEEIPYVENICGNLSENGLRSYSFKDSTLYIGTAQIDDEKKEVATAYAIKSVGKSNIFADRFNLLTQGFLLVSAIGLLIFSFLTLRDWRGGMRKIESGRREIPNDLSKRIDAPPIAELNAISFEINNLAEKLEENLRRQKTLEKDLANNEKLAALGRVASGVAHEVRNPLAAMKLKIQLAQRQNFDREKLGKTFAVLNEEIARLDQLISRMLDAGKPKTLNFKACAPSSIVRERLEFIEEKADAQNVKIETDFSDAEAKAEIDAKKITQVFDNLFNNALEAMPDGGILKVETKVENNKFIVQISDSGRGISEAERAKLFELFYTTKDKGTGLGLAISREIVEAHNGRLYLSESATGAVFVVELPLLK